MVKTSTFFRWILTASIAALLALTFITGAWITNQSNTTHNHHPLPMESHFLRVKSESDASVSQSKEVPPPLLPPSIWSRETTSTNSHSDLVRSKLSSEQVRKATQLCGKFLWSSLKRAITVVDGTTFVATGDIPYMWTRDSAVQMGIYTHRALTSAGSGRLWLKYLVQGAIQRQAFNILQDVYGNAYYEKWVDPMTLPLKERVIGRGGWVATRNYEVDSGAYFFCQIYDFFYHYFQQQESEESSLKNLFLLTDSSIFDAVELLVDTYILEQNHDTKSPYRYLELPQNGKGKRTGYTGLTWAGFRPSDDMCEYGYNIPTNIYVAAGLERMIILNKYLWKSSRLHQKMRRLLEDIEDGIKKHGVVHTKDGQSVYAYEVDGLGNALFDFDDANVPSLLSIPMLGWTKYDKAVYETTRQRLLNPKTNKFYHAGKALRGMGSPHTPPGYVWPMALSVEALTLKESASMEDYASALVFQVQQSLKAACLDAAHESVSSDTGCPHFSRAWFEWANDLFVVLVEEALGISCDDDGLEQYQALLVYNKSRDGNHPGFYQNRFQSDPKEGGNYQGLSAQIPFK